MSEDRGDPEITLEIAHFYTGSVAASLHSISQIEATSIKCLDPNLVIFLLDRLSRPYGNEQFSVHQMDEQVLTALVDMLNKVDDAMPEVQLFVKGRFLYQELSTRLLK